MYPFHKNGKVILLEKDGHESNENFYRRGNFIISNLDRDKDVNFDSLIILSRMYVNIKNHNLKYSKEVMDKISELEKNLPSGI